MSADSSTRSSRHTTPTRRLLAQGCLLLLLSSGGCAADPERARLMNEQYPGYSEAIKRAIDQGYLLHGMTYDQAYLVLGAPHCKAPDQHEGKTLETWMYPPNEGFPCSRASNKVYFEKGAVVGWKFLYTR